MEVEAILAERDARTGDGIVSRNNRLLKRVPPPLLDARMLPDDFPPTPFTNLNSIWQWAVTKGSHVAEISTDNSENLAANIYSYGLTTLGQIRATSPRRLVLNALHQLKVRAIPTAT